MLRLPGGSDSKESVCNTGNPGLIPGLGRSRGEGNSYPIQYSCQGKTIDRGQNSMGSLLYGPKSHLCTQLLEKP